MARETKAERDSREATRMGNLASVGKQFRQRAGLPERDSTEPTTVVPEVTPASGPEGGYGGEDNQPKPVERAESTSPGDNATLTEVANGRGQAIASGQVGADGELIESTLETEDETETEDKDKE